MSAIHSFLPSFSPKDPEPATLLPLDVVAHLGEFMSREERQQFLEEPKVLKKPCDVDFKKGFFQTECTLLDRKIQGLTQRLGQRAAPLSFEEIAALTHEMEGGALYLNPASCNDRRDKNTLPYFVTSKACAYGRTLCFIQDNALCIEDQSPSDEPSESGVFVRNPPRVHFRKPGQTIEAVTLDPEDQRVVFVSRDRGKIEVETWWGAIKGPSITKKSQASFISHLEEDSPCLLTSRYLAIWAPNCVEIFDVEKGRIDSTFSYKEATFSYVDLNKGYVLFADREGYITIFNFLNDPSKKVISQDCHQADLLTSMTVSADGLSIFSADSDGIIKAWDIQTGRCVRTLIPKEPKTDRIIRVLYSSPDSESVLAIYWHETGCDMKRWDFRTGLCSKDVHLFSERKNGAMQWEAPIFLTPDGTRLLYGVNRIYRIFDFTTHQRVAELPDAQYYAISADGMYLLSAQRDRAGWRSAPDINILYSLYNFRRSDDFSFRKRIYAKTENLLKGLGHDRSSPIQQQGKQARRNLIKDRVHDLFVEFIANPTIYCLERASTWLFVVTSWGTPFFVTDLATLFLTVQQVAYTVDVATKLTFAVFGLSISTLVIGGAIFAVASLITLIDPNTSPTTAKIISFCLKSIVFGAIGTGVSICMMLFLTGAAECLKIVWLKNPHLAIGNVTSRRAFLARSITYLSLGVFKASGFGAKLWNDGATRQSRKMYRLASKIALVAMFVFTLTEPIIFFIAPFD